MSFFLILDDHVVINFTIADLETLRTTALSVVVTAMDDMGSMSRVTPRFTYCGCEQKEQCLDVTYGPDTGENVVEMPTKDFRGF